MERSGFIFYRSFVEAARELNDEQRLEFYDAIADYGLDGVLPSAPSPIVKIMLKMSIPQIDANNKRYLDGGKGGRPSTKNLPCTKEEFISMKTIPDEWDGIKFPNSWIKERCARKR